MELGITIIACANSSVPASNSNSSVLILLVACSRESMPAPVVVRGIHAEAGIQMLVMVAPDGPCGPVGPTNPAGTMAERFIADKDQGPK
jgi:hypothetical protein